MTKAELVLEFLRVILSGPPLAAAFGLFVVIFFRGSLRELLARVVRVKFPGGEVATSQAERSSAMGESEGDLPKEAVNEPKLPAGLTLTPEDQKKLSDFISSERARAALWEYQFLNLYLAPHTQRVLDWLAELPQRPTVQMADAFWRPAIPSPQERRAVLNALLNHHLIVMTGELLEVTPKGQEYRRWRGPLPQLAP